MFGIGVPELILILIVGLIVFGPGKLPEVGRAVGKGIREFRKASSALQAVLNEPDPPPKPAQAPRPAASPMQTDQDAAAVGGTQPVAPAPGTAVAERATRAAASAEEATGTGTLTEVPYLPPTQESVRQEIEGRKREA